METKEQILSLLKNKSVLKQDVFHNTIAQFNSLKEVLKTTIQEVHRLVHKMSDIRNTQLIGWGVGVIGFLTAIIGYLITHYVLK